MRCPICDFDSDLNPNEQSDFFYGLSFDLPPDPYEDNGVVRCSCFSDEYDSDESENQVND